MIYSHKLNYIFAFMRKNSPDNHQRLPQPIFPAKDLVIVIILPC